MEMNVREGGNKKRVSLVEHKQPFLQKYDKAPFSTVWVIVLRIMAKVSQCRLGNVVVCH